MQTKTLVSFNPKDNLCTYTILPLLYLNKNDFGDDFIGCYLTLNDEIVVKVKEPVGMNHHPNYLASFAVGEVHYILFNIPTIFKKDVERFLEGKYSQISDLGKTLIREYSGLPYCLFDPNEFYSKQYLHPPYTTFKNPEVRFLYHPLLAALESSKVLRTSLENELDVDLEEDAELYSKPKQTEILNV